MEWGREEGEDGGGGGGGGLKQSVNGSHFP